MKRILALIALIIMLTFGGYICLKRQVLNKYVFHDEVYEEFLEELSNRTFLKIESQKNDNTEEYITIDKLSVKNEYQNFSKVEEGTNSLIGEKYVLYGEDGNFIASISFGKDYIGKVEMIKSQDIMGKKRWRTDYLNYIGVKDDLDLFNYLITIKNKEYNFFSKIKEIKGDYEIHNILSDYALGNEVVFFTGDLEGYMTKIDAKTREAFIIKDRQSYYIAFTGLDYFNNEKIREVLENLIIE